MQVEYLEIGSDLHAINLELERSREAVGVMVSNDASSRSDVGRRESDRILHQSLRREYMRSGSPCGPFEESYGEGAY